LYTGIWWGNLKEEITWGHRCRWQDDIKMDFLELGCEGMDWIDLAQDRDRWWALVNGVMNLRVP